MSEMARLLQTELNTFSADKLIEGMSALAGLQEWWDIRVREVQLTGARGFSHSDLPGGYYYFLVGNFNYDTWVIGRFSDRPGAFMMREQLAWRPHAARKVLGMHAF